MKNTLLIGGGIIVALGLFARYQMKGYLFFPPTTKEPVKAPK